ncbi:1-aminocyclopropane-1-carboxylate oxidase homolog 1-like [Fagus crenata]
MLLSPSKNTQFTIPVIDLSTRGYDVVAGVRCVAEAVEFFQVVNHGIGERVGGDVRGGAWVPRAAEGGEGRVLLKGAHAEGEV